MMLRLAIYKLSIIRKDTSACTAQHSVCSLPNFPWNPLSFSSAIFITSSRSEFILPASTTKISDISMSLSRTLLGPAPPPLFAPNYATNWVRSEILEVLNKHVSSQTHWSNAAWAMTEPIPSSRHSSRLRIVATGCAIEVLSESLKALRF